MTFEFLLPWATAAVSLFNTVILLWLGLTVLLNAPQRNGGVWLAGLGLLVGGAFFAAHTAMLDYSLSALMRGIRSWWSFGWCAIIGLPCGWYGLMLWYAGFWEERDSALRRRHTSPMRILIFFAIALALLALLINPFRVLDQVARLPLQPVLSLGGLPWLVVLYPIYLLTCIALALDVLRRPHISGRALHDVARNRARPWLVASTLVQLVCSLLIACAILAVVVIALNERLATLAINFYQATIIAELILSICVALAVILLGKAIVSYEIFTGKTLPRRGFFRQWRVVVMVAAVFGALVSWSLNIDVRPIYPLLLTTILMSVFLAVFSWRSYREHENHIDSLRSFASSQHFYQNLLQSDVPDSTRAFSTLCDDVLDARRAYLFPLGNLAALVGAPLCHPADCAAPSLGALKTRLESTSSLCLKIEPENFAGAQWAIGLWAGRGLIGALLLDEKRDGSLYAQEEIEIAQAAGERLLDTRAGSILAQRLMTLQRTRLAESQVLDRRARRALHDDVLPRVHTAMLQVSALRVLDEGAKQESLSQLSDVHKQISDLLREMPLSPMPEIGRLGFIGALQHLFQTEWRGAFDDVSWQIAPDFERGASQLSPLCAEVLFYATREAIRNAARYAAGNDSERRVKLRICASYDAGCDAPLQIAIEDDGVGFNEYSLQNDNINFSVGANGDSSHASGNNVSSNDASGRGGSGRGLALHSTMMAIIGGTLSVEKRSGGGSRLLLSVACENREIESAPQIAIST